MHMRVRMCASTFMHHHDFVLSCKQYGSQYEFGLRERACDYMRVRVLLSLSLYAVMYTGVLNVRLVAAHLRSDHPQAVSKRISRYDCLHLGILMLSLLLVCERARVCSFVCLFVHLYLCLAACALVWMWMCF